MKEGWKLIKLDELCVIERGGSPRPIDAFLTDDADGINWIKISDATASSKYIYKTEQKIKPEGIKSSRIVNEGDFILSNSMSFGRPYIMKTNGCIHDGWLVLRQPKVNPDYLYLVLSSDFVYQQFDRLASGSTVRNLNIGLVKSVEIPVPSELEQQRIVAILDEAFEAIAAARANAEQNRQNARALFESYLEAVFNHAWQTGPVVSLSDLATDITDGDHMPPPKSETGVPFITIGNIQKDTQKIDFSNTFKVPHEYFSGLKTNKKPQYGDVLYTVTGSFGIPVLVESNAEFCFQRHIGLVRPKAGISSNWLYYLLMSPQVFKQAKDGATGTAQKTVSLKLLRSFKVPRVMAQQQLEAVMKLDALRVETQRLESLYQRKIAALDELKQSLLQQAFSGSGQI
ncbi:restriction endonuclease subunit S [Aeromonas caviae]|uniref:restriction endonuclease subunit S n=1 Tax=Aeromonas caviae TaxID=648 RepID=UPI002B471A04|nr:restriction endonuclease subunit S [Aeromonas caviae]